MPVITFNELVYKSKMLLHCRIKKGMNGDEVLCAITSAIEEIENFVNLDKVKIIELGLEKCDRSANLLTRILNALIAADKAFALEIQTIKSQIEELLGRTDLDTDEKVKTMADDGQAGYLTDKVYSPQTGSITVVEETISGVVLKKLNFMGFAPVGSVFWIDASRVGDLDNTGKGKAGTDLWGYALSNGQNGTRNRLNYFPRNVAQLSDAGNTGGKEEFTVKKENIGSFDLAVNGSISDALVDDIEVPIKFDTNKIADGSGGSTHLLRLGTGLTGAQTMKGKFNAKHTHSFSLSSKHVNAAPTAIPLVPKYMYEIPIQRIF